MAITDSVKVFGTRFFNWLNMMRRILSEDAKGWIICACVLVITIVRSGITYSFGVFVVELESVYKTPLAEQSKYMALLVRSFISSDLYLYTSVSINPTPHPSNYYIFVCMYVCICVYIMVVVVFVVVELFSLGDVHIWYLGNSKREINPTNTTIGWIRSHNLNAYAIGIYIYRYICMNLYSSMPTDLLT